MKANIVLLPGDGIGPDVVDAAVRVLNRVAERFGHEWTFSKQLIGGVALKAGLPPLPPETLAAALKAGRDSARRRRRSVVRQQAAR